MTRTMLQHLKYQAMIVKISTTCTIFVGVRISLACFDINISESFANKIFSVNVMFCYYQV